MARGWESKSVEDQIETARERVIRLSPELSPEQASAARERDGLLLSRTRVVRDLETAVNPRYRVQLQAALQHLDDKIALLA